MSTHLTGPLVAAIPIPWGVEGGTWGTGRAGTPVQGHNSPARKGRGRSLGAGTQQPNLRHGSSLGTLAHEKSPHQVMAGRENRAMSRGLPLAHACLPFTGWSGEASEKHIRGRRWCCCSGWLSRGQVIHGVQECHTSNLNPSTYFIWACPR
jgi:hypothetical protein